MDVSAQLLACAGYLQNAVQRDDSAPTDALGLEADAYSHIARPQRALRLTSLTSHSSCYFPGPGNASSLQFSSKSGGGFSLDAKRRAAIVVGVEVAAEG